MNLDLLDEIMRTHGYRESDVIAMLQDIQKQERYLPEGELRMLAERVGMTPGRVYALATFYKTFGLKPRGRNLIKVCMGTACHVGGGSLILDKLTRDLGVEAGEMTRDGRFTVEPVRCVGCCGLAPVVVVNEDFYGKVTQRKTSRILENYK